MNSNNDEKIELIKPKSKKQKLREDNIKETINKNKSIIVPTLMGIVGIIFLTNSNDIIIYACYIIGALIAGFGIYNVIRYAQIKEQLKIEDTKKLTAGIISIAIGILIILLASVIQTFLNLLIGLWLITTGIMKIIDSGKVDTKTKNFYLIESIIYIGMGLYSIFFQNILLTIIGIWMIIASGIEIYNQLKNKD
ncbi:MAG: hypothetical protein E7158_01680 [Firmicutes bacterium]|nr:hypothetical protein [Bacillota bacterium]